MEDFLKYYYPIHLTLTAVAWIGIALSWKEINDEDDTTKVRLFIGAFLPVINFIHCVIVVDWLITKVQKVIKYLWA